MMKWLSRMVFAIGLGTIAFSLYVGSFYTVRNNIIVPHEIKNREGPHFIRPIYNRVYKPMRWFEANGRSFRAKRAKIYYGTILSKSVTEYKGTLSGNLGISTAEGSHISIGFTGKKDVLREFDKLVLNSYAKFEFGVALSYNHNRFINRLVSFEAIDLREDPRIERKDYSKEKTDTILRAFNGLVGEEKSCALNFVRDYKDRVLAHCQQAGYARNIGGGCHHIVGYSAHGAVFEAALEVCAPERLPTD